MDILLRYLDSDTTRIVCEFLIYGDDYTPFTLENIRQLEARIHNWSQCMQWAARDGHMLILKYVVVNVFFAPLLDNTHPTWLCKWSHAQISRGP